MAQISYFSDVLCVWAYVAHMRLEELLKQFGDQIEVDAHFCSVFGDAHGKIETVWADRGSYEGFNAHLKDVGNRFPHVDLHDRLWLDVKPRSSTSAHLFLKAVAVVEEQSANVPTAYLDTLSHKASWALRRAFFAEARDVADWKVQAEIAESLGLEVAAIRAAIDSGEAIARLDADQRFAEEHGVSGSPTLMMNEGRQKLYGNVGYRLIEANVEELLRNPAEDEASWC